MPENREGERERERDMREEERAKEIGRRGSVESSALGQASGSKGAGHAAGWIKRAEKVGVNLTEETASKKR